MPALPDTEERILVTRDSVDTWFATASDWPFHIPSIAALCDGTDVELVNRPIAGGPEATYSTVPVGSRRPVQCQVFGSWDLDGVPIIGDENQRAQLLFNLGHLMTNVIASVPTGDGTVDVELFAAHGDSVGVKPAQFIGPLRTTAGDSPIEAIVTLDFYFPNGVFDLSSTGS